MQVMRKRVRYLGRLVVAAGPTIAFALVVNMVMYNGFGADWHENAKSQYALLYYTIVLLILLLMLPLWITRLGMTSRSAAAIGTIVSYAWIVTIELAAVYTGSTLGLMIDSRLLVKIMLIASMYAIAAVPISVAMSYSRTLYDRRWQYRRARCWRCGYPLSPSLSVVCPECGFAADDEKAPASQSEDRVRNLPRLMSIALILFAFVGVIAVTLVVVQGIEHRMAIMRVIRSVDASTEIVHGVIIEPYVDYSGAAKTRYIDGVEFLICGLDGDGGITITFPRYAGDATVQVRSVKCSVGGRPQLTRPAIIVTYRPVPGRSSRGARLPDSDILECLIQLASQSELGGESVPISEVLWLDECSDPCSLLAEWPER